MKIKKINAREVYDSRGWPTVQCEITLEDGMLIYATAPTGLSLGHYEAHELRDGDERFWGKGVRKSVEVIKNIIGPALLDKEPNGPNFDIIMIDLDGTIDKSKLGANSIIAVSMAVYKAQAYAENLQLYELIAYLFGSKTIIMPLPLFNVINGGIHAGNSLNIQEFLLIPLDAPKFRDAYEQSIYVYHELKNIFYQYEKSFTVGDEGGFAPQKLDDDKAIEILIYAIEKIKIKYQKNFVIGLDCSATQYYNSMTGLYNLNGKDLHTHELINRYKKLIETYPIYLLEDPLADTDTHGWQLIMQELGHEIQIVGDDIFATNFHRIEEGIKQNIANSTLIKPNQIGTITETLQTISLCKQNKMNTIISHRSGETNDTFIADLAVGTSAGQIKAGGCSRGERVAKYNRLLTIEDQLLEQSSDEFDEQTEL